MAYKLKTEFLSGPDSIEDVIKIDPNPANIDPAKTSGRRHRGLLVDFIDTLFGLFDRLTGNEIRGVDKKVRNLTRRDAIPARFLVAGDRCGVTNNTDQATETAGVDAGPAEYFLLRDSTGALDCFIDGDKTTVQTVKARWVRSDGSFNDRVGSYPALLLEDDPHEIGDVVRWTFLSGPNIGKTRLFQVLVPLHGQFNPEPTGETNDPNYFPFSPIEVGQAPPPIYVGIAYQDFAALKNDGQLKPGVDYLIYNRGLAPNYSDVTVVVHCIGEDAVAQDDAFTLLVTQYGIERQAVTYDAANDFIQQRRNIGPGPADAAEASELPSSQNAFTTVSQAARMIQAGFNTAPLLYARRDDGTQRLDFTDVQQAAFWANGNAYGGVGGSVTLTRPSVSNPLLGQGTVLDLNRNALKCDYGLQVYAGAKVLNNTLLYGGNGLILRSGLQVGTTLQGGVLSGRIVKGSDWQNAGPVILDGVRVINPTGNPYVTVGVFTLIMRNGSQFVGCVPDPATVVIYEGPVAVADVATWLRSLPGWVNNGSVSLRGNFTWAAIATVPVTNNAPYVTAVAITGAAVVGTALAGAYTYHDDEGDPENGTTLAWYRSDNNSGLNRAFIGGATGANYTLQPGDVGKFVQYAVTPAAGAGTSPGVETFSPPTAAVTAAPGSQPAFFEGDVFETDVFE